MSTETATSAQTIHGLPGSPDGALMVAASHLIGVVASGLAWFFTRYSPLFVGCTLCALVVVRIYNVFGRPYTAGRIRPKWYDGGKATLSLLAGTLAGIAGHESAGLSVFEAFMVGFAGGGLEPLTIGILAKLAKRAAKKAGLESSDLELTGDKTNPPMPAITPEEIAAANTSTSDPNSADIPTDPMGPK